jgi:hypothetical protein
MAMSTKTDPEPSIAIEAGPRQRAEPEPILATTLGRDAGDELREHRTAHHELAAGEELVELPRPAALSPT